MEAWQENLVERQQLLRLAGKLFAPYTLRQSLILLKLGPNHHWSFKNPQVFFGEASQQAGTLNPLI